MKINISHEDRLATVWLAQEEREDPAVKARLDALCADCKLRKYMVAVYHSGPRQLAEQTSGLLLYNRHRGAQIAGRGL